MKKITPVNEAGFWITQACLAALGIGIVNEILCLYFIDMGGVIIGMIAYESKSEEQ